MALLPAGGRRRSARSSTRPPAACGATVGDAARLQGHSVRAAAVGRAALAAAAAHAGVAGRARRDAFGPACIQPGRGRGSIYAGDIGAMSEDCLTLNIWAPAKASKAPVFVWIHGGALTRVGPRADVRRREARRARAGRRLDQLPARRPRLSRPSGAERRIATQRLGQLRPARPDRGAALGEAQHRGVRRRSGATSRSPANPRARSASCI